MKLGRRPLLAFPLLAVTGCRGCEDHPARLRLDGELTELSAADRAALQAIADEAMLGVRRLLPAAPASLELRLGTGANVIPETGETATTLPPDIVVVTVDPGHEGGAMGVLVGNLKAIVFHETHHLVRDRQIPRRRLVDAVVSEGMASVFERDFAGTVPPWTDYPEDVADWAEELFALPADVDRRPWLVEHPDGRRWIGYRVGTYLVERAMRSTGKSSAQLVTTPTDRIVARAKGE